MGLPILGQTTGACLANSAPCNSFPNTNAYHLPLIYGDHAPILVVPLLKL
jgi:hypothetical protein